MGKLLYDESVDIDELTFVRNVLTKVGIISVR
jgi:hypothetical protein